MTIIKNQDIRDYHQAEGISKSGLDLISKAPLFYYDTYLAPDKEPLDTDALKIGRLAHTMLLQPELIDKEFNILPCGKQINKETLEWYEYTKTPQFNPDDWKITDKLAKYIGISDKQNINIKDYIEVEKMIKVLKADPQVQLLLTDGEAELSFYERDGDFTKRCRADYIRKDGIVIDYKSVAGGFFSDGSPESFQRTAVKLGYHKGAAWYTDIIAKDRPVEGFIFLVQEKVRPYAYAIYQLSDTFIEAGRIAVNKNYELYKECKAKNDWPGYTKGIVEIEKPNWI